MVNWGHFHSNYTKNTDVLDKSKDFKVKRNYMKIQIMAIAAITYDVSNTTVIAIASGYIKNLVEAKIVSESALFLLLDKVHRAKDKVMSEYQIIGKNRFDSEDDSCILFDGRSDKTNGFTFNEIRKFKNKIVIQNKILDKNLFIQSMSSKELSLPFKS